MHANVALCQLFANMLAYLHHVVIELTSAASFGQKSVIACLTTSFLMKFGPTLFPSITLPMVPCVNTWSYLSCVVPSLRLISTILAKCEIFSWIGHSMQQTVKQ